MSILYLLLGILVLIICLVIIFLFFGLKLNIKLVNENNNFTGYIEIKWLFFKVFSKDIHDKDKSKNKFDEDKKEDEQNEKVKENKWEKFKPLIHLIRKNLDLIFDFIIVCINSIDLEKFDTHLILGFSSPVATANTVGYIWVFSTILNLLDNFNLYAEPTFSREAIDFNTEIIFKIKLINPVWSLLKLITKKRMLKLIWELKKLG